MKRQLAGSAKLFAFSCIYVSVINAAFAEEAGSEQQLGEMAIKASKPAVPANLPATTEGVTAKQIDESINAVTSAETIKYMPSITIRERFIGDRNSAVATRTTAAYWGSAQSIVYADNLLLSNFLSTTTPPRWGMVSPEEIERVDIIYGPFSALYPGNSMGGVIQMTTRMPEKLEAHVKLDAFGQRFKLYGTDANYNGSHGSASVGNKLGDWSLWASLDRLDSEGHPMSFGTTAFKDALAGGTAVTGQYTDTDPAGAARIITGGYSIDHSVQDNGKIKLAYDFSPTVRATYTLGVWQINSDTGVDSYLRDAAGNTVYNTAAGQYVRINNQRYTVSSLSPSHSESEHWMHGLSVKSNTRGVWDWEATASIFNQNKDISRSASNNGTDSGLGAVRPGGTISFGDGTGWQNLDLRGEWRPDGDLKSKHQVSFGYHTDRYELKSATYNVATDWLTGSAGTLKTNSLGKSETQALYLQDAVRLAPAWKLVAGGRLEQWKAFGGYNYNSGTTPTSMAYAERKETDFSPKVSLSYQASADWALRGSLGKAYRYPTVGEMFQTTKSGTTTILLNDPNLKPEQVFSGEFTAERALENGLWRISLFQEDKYDGLYTQSDTTVTPNVTSVQNIDKVRMYGIETALQVSDMWVRGFDLSGSVTYTDTEILQNNRHPSYVGNKALRIPDWRATLVGVYHASDRLSYSMALRYSGRQYNALDNSDINPDTYGAASSFLIADAKVVYKFAKQWSAAVGVDNIGNYKAYIAHPYPQRTVFANLKWDY